jgi:3-deoxy-D-manno-octulosonic-acid transferase
VDNTDLDQVRSWISDRPHWLAASTHEGEEARVARTHLTLRASIPDLLTVIVPRHPDRGAAIAAELSALGLNVAQRSLGQPVRLDTAVYIADTLGEMGLFYRLCSVVFVGKSMPQQRGGGGGQNPIEPALLECALIFGPDMSNFAAVAKTLVDAGAAVQVADETALTAQVQRLLHDPEALGHMVAAAKSVSQAEAGVMDRIMLALAPYFEGGLHARA